MADDTDFRKASDNPITQRILGMFSMGTSLAFIREELREMDIDATYEDIAEKIRAYLVALVEELRRHEE